MSETAHDHRWVQFLKRWVLPPMAAISDNAYLSAVRAGMVLVVPLTIIGGLFLVFSFLPISGWDKFIEPHLKLLQVPVTATFGMLAVFACFAIAYDLGTRFKQTAIVSATTAVVVFLMTQLQLDDGRFNMEGLGSKGLFTGIVIALLCVRVQKFFDDRNLVIRLPEGVPAVVYESFVALLPLLFLVLVFWLVRFVLGIDLDRIIQTVFQPLVYGLNTLPGILLYAFLVTLLWSIGINGDNTMDAVVAPIFLQYLAENVTARSQGLPLPYITAYGFFTSFVNVGGTGATIALALVLFNSREPGFRRVSRLSLFTQVFGINEPIFFGIPIVLNPIFMIPYILNALILTSTSYFLMDWNWMHRPLVNIPWTTPPIIGHYLVSGGDWRAAVWGGVSLVIAMAVYYPFAKVAERQRFREVAGIGKASG